MSVLTLLMQSIGEGNKVPSIQVAQHSIWVVRLLQGPNALYTQNTQLAKTTSRSQVFFRVVFFHVGKCRTTQKCIINYN